MSKRQPTGVRGISIVPKGTSGKRWRVQISTGGRAARQKTIYTFHGKRGEALEDAIRQRDGGLPVAPADETLAAYFNGPFLAAKERAGRRARTIETYKESFRLFIAPVLGRCRLRELIGDEGGVDIVEAWLAWLASPKASRSGRRLSPRSQQKAIRVLSAILRHACRGRRRAMNPLEVFVDDLPRPNYRRAGRRRAVSRVVAEAIVRAFDGHELEAVVALALGGGLRRGEVLGMPLDGVHELDDGRMEVEVCQVVSALPGGAQIERGAKTEGSIRTVTLPGWAAAKVRRQATAVKELRLAAGSRWEDNGLLFPRTGLRGCGGRHRPGAPMHPTTFSREFKKHLLAIGLGDVEFDGLATIRLHDLRHTSATLAAEAGIPLAVLGRRLGHVRAETTQGYVDPDRESDRLVANVFETMFSAEASK